MHAAIDMYVTSYQASDTLQLSFTAFAIINKRTLTGFMPSYLNMKFLDTRAIELLDDSLLEVTRDCSKV